MAIIVFYCRDQADRMADVEYYQQDIKALRDLGHNVIIATRYREISDNFDVLFIWWWTYALWPVYLARWKKKKSIITGVFNFRHDAQKGARDYFGRPWWQRILIRRALIGAHTNLFISKIELAECTDYFGINTGRYFPCTVGPEYQQDERPERRVELLNISWSGTGNLRRKGIFDLLEAVALLVREGIDVRLTLAGKRGDGVQLLQERIAQLNLGGRVRYEGEVTKERKLRLLTEHEIYVQPSYFEGFGLATAEAMASGAAVVTCDVGEVRHVVGDAAIFVQPGDIRSIADGIRVLLTDANRRRELQVRARRRIASQFSYGSKLEILATALAELGIVCSRDPVEPRC